MARKKADKQKEPRSTIKKGSNKVNRSRRATTTDVIGASRRGEVAIIRRPHGTIILDNIRTREQPRRHAIGRSNNKSTSKDLLPVHRKAPLPRTHKHQGLGSPTRNKASVKRDVKNPKR